MKRIIDFIIRFFAWILLHILFIFPVDERKIYFRSMLGTRYSCNPKYLYLYIREKFGDKYKYVWDIKTDVVFDKPVVIINNKLKKIFELMTSKYIIDNVTVIWWIPLRKSQIVINTWHGGGAYKHVGSYFAINLNKVKTFQSKWEGEKVTHYLSSCRKFTEIQSLSKNVPNQRFINTGLPRNAIFFYPEKILKLRKKVLDYFNFSDDTKILLYAPTYRGDGGFKGKNAERGLCEPNYSLLKETVGKKHGGQWKLLYRGHNYDYNIANKLPDFVVDATKYEDMQELLCAADILLTDYSSSMWDYALTKKPCLLYAPDIKQYMENRGFYTDPFSWPFPLAQNDTELTYNILNFDQTAYEKAVDKHFSDLGSYENKAACQKVLDAIGLC